MAWLHGVKRRYDPADVVHVPYGVEREARVPDANGWLYRPM
jgi:hypothetical protein